MSHWHYHLMRHKAPTTRITDAPIADYYAIHEYYINGDGAGWSGAACYVKGASVDEVKQVLQRMLEDIEKHGVKDYE